MFRCKNTLRFMHAIEIEMHNCEKLLEDQKVWINHDYHALWGNMEYYRNQIFIWLYKNEKNSRVRYL